MDFDMIFQLDTLALPVTISWLWSSLMIDMFFNLSLVFRVTGSKLCSIAKDRITKIKLRYLAI